MEYQTWSSVTQMESNYGVSAVSSLIVQNSLLSILVIINMSSRQ